MLSKVKEDISYEDKLESIKQFMFHECRDLRWISQVCGCIVFQAFGTVWSTTKDIFEIIVNINPHGCTNLPSA